MENENKKTTEMIVVAESALPEILKAEIDTQIATAKQYPRSLKVFVDKAMSMATFSEEVAESCSYSVPRDGKSVDGPSVRLAEIVVSSFGNIRAGARVIANDGKKITAQGICHDLESNYACTVEVQRRITRKDGRTYTEDMQVLTGNAACAIALRNAIFKVVPFAMVQPIYDEARKVAKGTAATLIARRDRAVAYFRELKVTDEQICNALHVKKVEDIDLNKLAILTGMKASLKNGETTIQTLFETPAGKIDIEDLSLLFEMKKDALSEKERKDGERILTNQEEASYPKLKKLLEGK